MFFLRCVENRFTINNKPPLEKRKNYAWLDYVEHTEEHTASNEEEKDVVKLFMDHFEKRLLKLNVPYYLI